MSGWFAMSRAMFEHPIFKGKPERVAGWAWILAKAAWKDTRQDAAGKSVIVKRGQLLTSYRQMSDATGISIQQIRTLINRLRSEHAIHTDTNNGRLMITVCNYDKYQASGDDTNTATNTGTNTASTQHQHTKEQDNNIPVGRADKSASIDPAKAVFDGGVKLLVEAGVKAGQARGIVGKWRKDYTDAEIIAALGAAQREGAVDPVAYIQKALAGPRARQTDAEKAERAWLW